MVDVTTGLPIFSSIEILIFTGDKRRGRKQQRTRRNTYRATYEGRHVFL